MKKILIVFLMIISFVQAAQINNPDGAVYDFTFENHESVNLDQFSGLEIVDKIRYDIPKEINMVERSFYTATCLNDSTGYKYCPTMLENTCVNSGGQMVCSQDQTKKCANVDGNWKCPLLKCNSDNMCSVGVCETSTPSATNFMPYDRLPIESETSLAEPPCYTGYLYEDGAETKNERIGCQGGETAVDTQTCGVPIQCAQGNLVGNQCVKEIPVPCPPPPPPPAVDNCVPSVTYEYSSPEPCPSGYTANYNRGYCERQAESWEKYFFYTYTCSNSSWTNISPVQEDPGCVDNTLGGCTNFTQSSDNCEKYVDECSNAQPNTNPTIECTSPMCDVTLNNSISYCLLEACPTAPDIFEENGECFAMRCPANSSLISNDKCQMEPTND